MCGFERIGGKKRIKRKQCLLIVLINKVTDPTYIHNRHVQVCNTVHDHQQQQNTVAFMYLTDPISFDTSLRNCVIKLNQNRKPRLRLDSGYSEIR